MNNCEVKSQKIHNQNKLLALLGFARKAGKLVSGDETCEINLKRKKVRLILLASDASEKTRERWQRLSVSHKVPCHEILSKEELSMAIGQGNRSVVAVTDAGFAGQMILRIQESAVCEGEEPGGGNID